MDQVDAGTVKKKWWRPGKRFTITVNFSTPDAEVFDELVAGLNISFSAMVKLGLQLLLGYYLLLIEGVRIKLHHPDGTITEPEILELLKLKDLVRKKQAELKLAQGGTNAGV